MRWDCHIIIIVIVISGLMNSCTRDIGDLGLVLVLFLLLLSRFGDLGFGVDDVFVSYWLEEG